MGNLCGVLFVCWTYVVVYLQRKGVEIAAELINKGVAEKLDLSKFPSSKTFRVADLGCSVGPNTFLAVQNILDSVELKYKRQGLGHLLPEFQVFFNDHASNDFNQLFTTLPPERRYYATGVPGSFHDRLFPASSLHFVHCSYAAHWLSRVPKELADKTSPAWNRGRIHYSNSVVQVRKSYEAQFFKDMQRFLNARAQEILHGGMLALLLPVCPNGTLHSKVFINKAIELLGLCLLDMAKRSIVSEEKIDSFNIPEYFATFEQVEEILDRNGCFSIEIMETFPFEKPSPMVFSSVLRAGLGPLIEKHFGPEILDELFDLLCKRFEDSFSIIDPEETNASLFVLLKHKAIELDKIKAIISSQASLIQPNCLKLSKLKK
ncbi:loganic acid O-methyltransferase-like [Ziziphus jujuba]|uniref:Loganic acid O-methyltransferase-like n=1 Tax=Ziziphus jujuba TaxID=326968 RepID=A0A6P3ZQ49_ZIZJJ|nr:loganic acid O-methyltransferase-like [Ziziphus jujuba]